MPRWLIRLLSAACLVVAGVIAYLSPDCGTHGTAACPGYALGVGAILRGERGVAALAILVIALVAVARLVWEGQLPDELTKDGVKWSMAAEGTEEAIQGLDAQLEEHGAALRDLSEATTGIVGMLEERINVLEREDRARAPS
jgi:hypothetical protein